LVIEAKLSFINKEKEYIYLTPSDQPGNGSLNVLVTIAGRTIATDKFSFNCPKSISPIAFVNTYVFGHPYNFALI
jgi:hypothetical protein